MNDNELAVPNNDTFLGEVIRESGVNIQACYQCQKCSGGCPVASAMDILPNQLIRQIQYGRREKVLSSKTIWVCASCQTCSVRCPNDIDIAKVMDSLRHLSQRSGISAGVAEIPLFHSVFLNSMKSGGRVHELSLILSYKLKTKDFMKDAGLGWEMFRRGKIKLFPQSVRGGKAVKEIFDFCAKEVGR